MSMATRGLAAPKTQATTGKRSLLSILRNAGGHKDRMTAAVRGPACTVMSVAPRLPARSVRAEKNVGARRVKSVRFAQFAQGVAFFVAPCVLRV